MTSFYGGACVIINNGGGSGEDGVGISNTEINENGELVLTYTDGTVKNVGKVTGTTFTPDIDEDGTLSWSNDGGEENPEPVNLFTDADSWNQLESIDMAMTTSWDEL